MLLTLLFLPFIAAAAIAIAARTRLQSASLAAAMMIAGLCVTLAATPTMLAGGSIAVAAPFLDEWGLAFSLRLDGLSWLFCLLIFGIGALIVLYTVYYMPPDDDLRRFLSTLSAFAGGMVGVVLADNLLLLVLFWEITSVASFLLIAYKYHASDARIAARLAFAVTGGGGLALLAGVLMLGHMAGTFEIPAMIARADVVRANPLFAPALTLVLIGAFAKSGQFPFHFWLPHAMAAPTPVSAYLHSATMVKAGIFLMLRLYPAFGATDVWFVLVTGAGAVTLVYGAYLALLNDDFKGLLAYSTLSHLGLITLLIGLNTALSVVAAIFHVINHAIFKAALFMTAGVIDHECGTRDMRRINGMMRYMPITATLGVVSAASMAGVPFFNGFLSKEMFFAETLDHHAFSTATAWILPVIATLAGVLSVAYATRFIHDVFFNGEPIDLPRTPHDPAMWMLAPVMVLVALVLFVGLAPQISVGAILTAASHAVAPNAPPVKLALWHGFNLPLAMSIVAMGGGVFYYVARGAVFAAHRRLAPGIFTPNVFEAFFAHVSRGADWLQHKLDRRSSQRYLALVLIVVVTLATFEWFGAGAPLAGALAGPPVDAIAFAGFGALAIGALGTVVMARERVIAIMFLSVVGLVVSLAFIRFAGPDLALTQLSVEVASIIMLLLSLRYLPRTERADHRLAIGQAALAGMVGLGVAGAAYAMLTRSFDTISGYHIAQSVPGGGGTNVVNVTLVDFRGFDTFGEIAVLGMAALGLQSLLAGLQLAPIAKAAGSGERHPLMLRMMARPLLPLALTVSLYIFLRGHNLPGGGFIAGLIGAVAIVIQFLAGGLTFAQARLTASGARVIGLGVGVALITGAASVLFGYPFLTSTFAYLSPPIIGKFEVASAMAFDVGVYLVVIAGVVTILVELGRLSQRPPVSRAESRA
jgi:multicomponent K+:H+ antiporter subunit A